MVEQLLAHVPALRHRVGGVSEQMILAEAFRIARGMPHAEPWRIRLIVYKELARGR